MVFAVRVLEYNSRLDLVGRICSGTRLQALIMLEFEFEFGLGFGFGFWVERREVSGCWFCLNRAEF